MSTLSQLDNPVREPVISLGPSGTLLAIKGLAITVPGPKGRVEAIHGAAFDVRPGEAVGLVGESGSGKTLTCRAVLGVLPRGCEVSKGSVSFAGTDLVSMSKREWQDLRGTRMGAIFQDPASYLNPSLSVGDQLREVLQVKAGLTRRGAKKRAIELFEAVGLRQPGRVYHQIPGELSGGMLQRVMIAIAISCEPDLIVADEATTALDVITQAEIIELLRSLVQERMVSVLFVSHDLAVVAELCDRIVVFYGGEVVESGDRERIMSAPQHPYTEALLRVGSMRARSGGLDTIPGQPPVVGEVRPGCRFAGRCGFELDVCSQGPVPLTETSPGRWVRCVRADELRLGASA